MQQTPTITVFLIVWFAIIFRLLFSINSHSHMSDKINSLSYQTRRQKGSQWVNTQPYGTWQHGLLANSPLSMWIISRLPENLWPISGIALNIFSDLLTGLMVYLLLLHFLPPASATNFNGLTVAEWGFALVLFNPALLASDARVAGGAKGRALGLSVFTAYFLFLWVFLNTGYILTALILVALVPLLVLTSAFGTQSLIFFSFFLSASLLDYRPLAMLLIGFTVAYFTPRLGCREIIKWKIAHYVFYCSMAQKNLLLNRSEGVKNSLRRLNDKGERLKLLYWLFYKSDLFQIGLVLLPLLPVLRHISNDWSLGLTDPNNLGGFSFWMIVAGLITAITTSIKPLRFLGKGNRYIEYLVPFFIIWLAMSFHDELVENDTILIMMAISVTLSIFNYIKLLPQKMLLDSFSPPKNLDQQERSMLRSLSDGRILCLPLKIGRWVSGEFEGSLRIFQRLVFSSIRDSQREIQDWELLQGPLSAEGVRSFCEKHQIDFVVIMKEYFSTCDFQALESVGVVIFNNGRWQIYNMKCSRGNPPEK